MAYYQCKTNPEYVSTGDSFRIFHKQFEGYLSIATRNLSSQLSEEIQVSTNIHIKDYKDVEVCEIGARKHDIQTDVARIEIFIEKEPSSRSI